MDLFSKSGRKVRDKYKKREGLNISKISQDNLLKDEKKKNHEKNIESLKIIKKSKEKIEEKESENFETLINKKNHIKNNKSINYILSDGETTAGDTDYTKRKYVYRKTRTKNTLSFAISNFATNKYQQILTNEKKNRINYSMPLNKFFKEHKKKENNINTNNNFYRKQYNLLENFRSNYSIKNLGNNINENNKSRNYIDVNPNLTNIYEKNEKIINIEDLLILEEKFNEVLISVKTNINTPNECFELLNSYQQSSLYNNFDNYFKEISSKEIIHISILYIIYDVIICYNFSFDYSFFSTCYQYLESILEINYKSYLLLCQLILLKIYLNEKNNIWVNKLRNMLKNKLKHIELNNKDYIDFLMEQNKINYKNPNLNILLEIKYNSHIINKYLQLFLNSINSENKFKNDFCLLFDIINSNNLSEDKLLYFFKSKIIRIINQNASVAGMKQNSFEKILNENNIQVPYLKYPCPKNFSLVLDLDETLISFRQNPNEENKGTIRFRPFLDSFLKKVKEKYELIVFTSGTKDYADPLVDAIEQERKYFDARLYRQHTIAYGKDIVKDISKIGRDLSKIIIVENIPQNYRLQKENGILIKSFYGEDIYDNALVLLGDILIKIANEFIDLRIGISKYKNEILDKVSTNLYKKQ